MRKQTRCLAPSLNRTGLGATPLVGSANSLMIPAHTSVCVVSRNSSLEGNIKTDLREAGWGAWTGSMCLRIGT
jgi:hypothetical protein